MLTKKRIVVLSYICGASLTSVFLMGSVCDKTPPCFVGNVQVADTSAADCARQNEEYAAKVLAAQQAAARAAQQANQPTPNNESPMGGGMMEGGMMEGGMMEGGMQGPN